MREMRHDLWVRLATWFLAVSYGIGAPVTAFLEYRSQALSQRFGYPQEFIYLVCGVQLICSVAILSRPLAAWAAAALSAITMGAIVSHLRMDSPAAAAPAVIYTAVQVWVGFRSLTAKTNPEGRNTA